MAEAARAFISDREADRLRGIYQASFPEEKPTEFSDKDDFDWSVTLGNIAKLSDAAKTAGDRLALAELRAERAEKKAAEALQWLRRLHQAVLDGMPGEATEAPKAAQG